MENINDYLLIAALSVILLSMVYCGWHMFTKVLTVPEKMMIEKALRFYEDVACCIAPHSTKLEELSDDLRTIDKIKEKIK